jgi:hypothetical protein
MSRRVVSIAFALALASAGPVDADTQVTTFAGSGVTGFADGGSARASFMLPLGVAYDAAGNLYVADAAAQRIRKISRDGSVTTLAGGGTPDASGVWVPGGYADGDGPNARFNHPSALALSADGRIYVADSYNHCIRVVTTDGRVTTLAGSPAQKGVRAGRGVNAGFIMPMGLAFDRAQNLYVVDAGLASALLKIDRDGNVSQIRLPGHVQPPGGLAVVDSASGPTFAVADLTGLYIERPDGHVTFYRNEYFRVRCAAGIAEGYAACSQAETMLRGHRDIGAPFGVVAYNDHAFAYTDFRTNSVRYVDVRTSTGRLLAGYALGDGSGRGAGSRDGDGTNASFNMPFGIAVGPGGELAIADGGSRRIRIVRNVDHREPLLPAELAAVGQPSAVRVVAYAGSSAIWQGTEWADSIEGRLERRLNAAGCAGCASLRVVPVLLDPLGVGLAALTALPDHRFDVLLLQLNIADAASLAKVDVHRATTTPQLWRPALSAALHRLDAAVKRHGARLVVVVEPSAQDVGPAVGAWGRASAAAFDGGESALQLGAAVAADSIPVADAAQEFRSAERSAVPPALYASDGEEVAGAGREALAGAAARGVLGLHL